MSYKIERLNNPMTYLISLNADFDFKEEYLEYHHELLNALNNEAQPINMIIDMRKVSISFDDLLTATKQGRDSSQNPFRHHNTKTLQIVTNNNLIKASIAGFVKLGIAKQIQVFDSVDEALQQV